MSSFTSNYRNLQSTYPFLPKHGGDIESAVSFFNIKRERWLDLSTGINPNSWMSQNLYLPDEIFQRLPEKNDELQLAALRHYLTCIEDQQNMMAPPIALSASNILPCAGSQQAIQWLPQLRQQKSVNWQQDKVWVTDGSFSGHRESWENAGFRVNISPCQQIERVLVTQKVDVLVVINPDNPTGYQWDIAKLLSWAKILSRRGGWLIVDEAFAHELQSSVCSQLEENIEHLSGIFVLKSVGKFFGLAGIRSGFVISSEKNIKALSNLQGDWALGHVAQYITQKAFMDSQWITSQIQQLSQQSQRLNMLISKYFGIKAIGSSLFQTFYSANAYQYFYKLAEKGILVRFLPATQFSNTGIRIGLPANEPEWERLELAIKNILSE